MAIGEWVSVQSTRELYQRQVRTEAAELRSVPEEEREELALIYEAKGLSVTEAEELAERLMADTKNALDTMVREELGLDPSELGGVSQQRGGGFLLPLRDRRRAPAHPFFFATGAPAVGLAIGCPALGLFLIGSLITLLTGRSVLFSGSRQVRFGMLAAGVTFGLGRLIGAAAGV
jgi:VIT1/CCC1 family predicted Fe2+/Mn2+ transporter